MDEDELLARRLQTEEDAAAALAFSSLHVAQAASPFSQHQGHASFTSQIDSGIKKVLAYEDDLAQALALSVMDLCAMQQRAEEQSALSTLLEEDPPLAVEDALALELLKWFKLEGFFRWTDQPPCNGCANPKTRAVRTEPPNAEEAEFGAGRTELYACGVCGTFTRFPRYNDPVKLLETRTGRCGEWANCFCLCCRAAGLDARLVLDWTDHIWVEYYSAVLGRWVHMDPCEAAADKPLLYEVGWGKKLSYLVAVGRDGVDDVTQRYTMQYDDVMRRRPLEESWVAGCIQRASAGLRANLSTEERRRLEARSAADAAAMAAACRAPQSVEALAALPGRQTGSADWVSSRGEGGSGGGGSRNNTMTCSAHRPAAAAPTTRYRRTKLCTTAAVPPSSATGDAHMDLSFSGNSNATTPQRISGGVARASGENAPGETADFAFDGDLGTKWLDFGGCKRDTSWLEYRLLPSHTAVVLQQYALVSANDAPERDPEHVMVEAWDERGAKWVAVDERAGLRFSGRGRKLKMAVGGEKIATRRWRLRILSVLHSERANSTQLGGWELFGS